MNSAVRRSTVELANLRWRISDPGQSHAASAREHARHIAVTRGRADDMRRDDQARPRAIPPSMASRRLMVGHSGSNVPMSRSVVNP
jgi:hypothetical protein